MRLLLLLLAAGAAVPAAAQPSPARLEASVRTLVGFGTRHTLSDTLSTARGIGAARRWLHAELEALSAACGGCLEVRYQRVMLDSGASRRIDRPVELVNVLAIRHAADTAAPVLVVQAHYDSRASRVMDDTSDAPGANDNGSGSALVLEAARLLSIGPAPGKTLVFALLAGEEQGLLGARALVDLARERGWRVEAVLNNDVVGNVHGIDGYTDSLHVRVFSVPFTRGPADSGTAVVADVGGENDGPSRQLARFVEQATAGAVPGLAVRPVPRRDRVDRGGDHIPWSEAGVAAVRFSEARENYERQHQDVRVENGVRYGDLPEGVNFPYLARVTAANVAVLRALADAPAPPATAGTSGAVSSTTTVRWSAVPGATGYRVVWRPAASWAWTDSRMVEGATELVLPGVLIDDHYFGVAAVGPGGEGIVRLALP